MMLAPSRFTAQKHRDAGLENDIQVLPLFSTLAPAEPPEYKAAVKPRFVFAGRVTASKGVEAMLRIFSGLEDVDLQVVGDGDLLETLQRVYADSSNIHFLGAVSQPELIALNQNATALILPSLAPETFGLTVVEAFACGTPAIVRIAGGNRELIEGTGAGFVYATDNELVQAVDSLVDDAGLRIELGKKARESYTAQFTTEHHMESYLAHITAVQKQKNVVVH